MKDIVEHLEAGAEANYYEMLQPDGRLKCGCGRIFNPDREGGVVSSSPYAMSICEDCFEKWSKARRRIYEKTRYKKTEVIKLCQL